jgi:Copper transport outer membrane protein, MctB
MFDLRYHVASLAAVFIALVIGILVGVGISSQGVISTNERDVLNERIAELKRERDSLRQRASDLSRAQRAAQTFVERTYPALMSGRLRATRVAVLFVGSVDGGLRSEIDQTLVDADSPGVTRLRALKVPLDVRAVDRILASRRALARYVGTRHLDDLGSAMAAEFVAGGRTPLWNALTRQLVEERDGSAQEPIDAVVVVRSAPAQQRGTSQFLGGLYKGLTGSGASVIGAESAGSQVTAIETYRKYGLSSVDDVDTRAGRLALAVLLAGGEEGHYGVKATADGLLPPVEPVSVTTTSG